ncbi:hypothetical protein HX001_05920 [Empedobacter brevis]|uniref:Uncharacterized protein n=1 Tax=Empedobacter brevis TaxID=247 RepID=A0AAJ1QDH7_9FLAO|nr:hypothetical protein [Empedobacter brevis]MDM1072030.1 hypothetical protein [Empedobacter brevis]
MYILVNIIYQMVNLILQLYHQFFYKTIILFINVSMRITDHFQYHQSCIYKVYEYVHESNTLVDIL